MTHKIESKWRGPCWNAGECLHDRQWHRGFWTGALTVGVSLILGLALAYILFGGLS